MMFIVWIVPSGADAVDEGTFQGGDITQTINDGILIPLSLPPPQPHRFHGTIASNSLTLSSLISA